MNLLECFPEILRKAAQWAAAGEQIILSQGRPLRPDELQDAAAARVRNPAGVRVLAVPSIPVPEDQLLKAANEQVAFVGKSTAGLALGRGIFLRKDFEHNRRLLIHELVHVGQYERLGGIEAFLSAYLLECLQEGYPHGPLEQEAVQASGRLAGSCS